MNCPHCQKPITIRVGKDKDKLRFHMFCPDKDPLFEDVNPFMDGQDFEFEIEAEHEVVMESVDWEVQCPHCRTKISSDMLIQILKEEPATEPVV